MSLSIGRLKFVGLMYILLWCLVLFIPSAQGANPDIYEENNSFTQANIIVLNDTQTLLPRNFHIGTDEDWVKLYAVKDEIYTIKVYDAGADCDAVIELFDTDGNTLLAEKDDMIAGQTETLTWHIPQDGVHQSGIYYVRIRPYSTSAIGPDTSYRLDIYRPHSCMTGVVTGTVVNAYSTSPTGVSGVRIKTDENDTAVSESDGSYRLIACEASGTVTLTADGYDLYASGISITPMKVTNKDFVLTPSPDLIVSPLTASPPASGGTFTIQIDNNSTGSMAWIATVNDSWLTINGNSTGTNTGTVTIQAAPNQTDSERSGTVAVSVAYPGAKNSPQVISVTQPRPRPPTLSVTPDSHDFGSIRIEEDAPRSRETMDSRTLSLSPLEQLSHEYVQNQVIVKTKSGTRTRQSLEIAQDLNAQVLTQFSTTGGELWQISETVENAVMQYWNDPDLEYMEPNHKLHPIGTIPSDADFSELWGLHNAGQTGGTADADIDAPEAWAIQSGTDVIIAVIDTGVDYTHPDLADNMWINAGEIPGNSVDDDNNGFVDDVYGYDFANDDGDPVDDQKHGTHCAGTIAGVGNNETGVTGVNWSAKIMALKFLTASGRGSTADAVKAIEYATRMGAKITSNSWGGGGFSNTLYEAIRTAEANGILFVAAAGNQYQDTDSSPHFPSCYPLDRIISVAATDYMDNLSSFSNYGFFSVDIGAPGSNIYSTVLNGGYASLNGTSMATPHVSGAAALVWGACPSLTPWEVKESLLAAADPLSSLYGKCSTGGRLNLYKALTLHKQVFTLTNDGDLDMVFGDLAISGADAADFAIQEDQCSGQTLGAGESCTVKVAFIHQTVGQTSAALSIPSNDPQAAVKLITLTAERTPAPVFYILNINKSGEGHVKVNDLACDTFPCNYTFAKDETITLSPMPDGDFINWSGDAAGSDSPYVLTLSGDTAITANFGGGETGWAADVFATGELVDGLSYEEWQSAGDETIQVNQYKVSIGVGSQFETKPAPPSPPQYSVKLDLRKYENDKWDGPFLKDVRQNGKAIYRWILGVNPHGNIPPPDHREATLSWNPSSFNPAGSYTLWIGYEVDALQVAVSDMRSVSQYTITGGDAVQYFTIEYQPAISGWEAEIFAQGEELDNVDELSLEEWQNSGEDESILVNAYKVTIGMQSEILTKPAPPAPPKYTVKMDLRSIDNGTWKGPYLKDIRQNTGSKQQWILSINPHGNMPPPEPRSATLKWMSSTLNPKGLYRLRQGYDGTGDIVVSDMRSVSEYIFTGGDGASYYVIEYDPEINPNATVGDVDADGAIELRDAIAALRILAGIDSPVTKACDVNDDGHVGIAEALYVLSHISNK